MATFVLVHGAWHGAWCWEEIRPLLDARGHRVIAPDLPGMGSDTTPLAKITLASWARWVADLVAAQPEPVVLVGHSRGGVVVSQAADLIPDRVAILVYLTAFLVPDGSSMIATRERAGLAASRKGLLVAVDGTTSVEADAIGPAMYNRTPERFVRRAREKFCSEPGWVFSEMLSLSPDRYGRIPRAYIETLADQAISIDLQRFMQRDLPCDPVITLDTDHSPFFSAIDETVAALDSLAARLAAGISG